MHTVNRAAFFNLDSASLVLRLYTKLVALEITLKDKNSSNYGLKHAVTAMVDALGDNTLSSKANALRAALNSLWCTDRDGAQRQVKDWSYPDIRYLRHDADYPGTSTDTDLANAIQVLDELLDELKRQGVKPC